MSNHCMVVGNGRGRLHQGRLHVVHGMPRHETVNGIVAWMDESLSLRVFFSLV